MRPSILVLAVGSALFAHTARGDEWEGPSPPPPFERRLAPIGDVTPAKVAAPAYATSSRIAVVTGGVIVSDADSGKLLRTDALGKLVDELAIGADAGLLAYDGRRAFVADRRGDRIVVVDVGLEKLAVLASWKTPAEPYAVALTPDRKLLLVATIADRTLVAFDAATGTEAWRRTIDAEPRGLAVSPDGTRVVIASLANATLEQLALDGKPLARRIALPIEDARQRARGAFATTFVGSMAVASYQLARPVAQFTSAAGQYGGSFEPPMAHHVAWIGADGRQAMGITNVNEPRALAWDRDRDILYIAGLADDTIVAVPKASQVDLGGGEPAPLRQRCGADGLALAPDGDVYVWCSFTRSVVHFDRGKWGLAKADQGPTLAPSSLGETEHAGLVLFHTANDAMSTIGAMSCGNCHLDARADGLSWRIGDHELQTPMLAGRIANTEPYKWNGGAATLAKSLRETMTRLGGTGLGKKELAALTAYVQAIPAVRTPARDHDAIARGKKLFESDALGCASCHEGPAFTDKRSYELVGAKATFDTPSLVGVAASAPYFHDGSAATLEAVLRDRGRVHGMSAGATKLRDGELRDLIAFLESL
jgi:sugar lactone lactonase YvrE